MKPNRPPAKMKKRIKLYDFLKPVIPRIDSQIVIVEDRRRVFKK